MIILLTALVMIELDVSFWWWIAFALFAYFEK